MVLLCEEMRILTNLYGFKDWLLNRTKQKKKKNSSKKIVEFVNNEVKDVWRGVKALIETDYNWNSYIIEGVAIIPHLISDFIKKNIKTTELFIRLFDPE